MFLFLADMSTSDTVNVIPESVHVSSIQITGTWDQFFIRWDPVMNVNYDQVFYEVKIYDFSRTDFSEPVCT
jgi:hypothetical protein